MPVAQSVNRWERVPISRIEDLSDAVYGAGLEATQMSRGHLTGSLIFSETDGIACTSGLIDGRVSLFGPLSRDGAGMVEVGIRMQKSLASLARNRDAAFAPAASRHSALALKRAEIALHIEEDLQQVRLLALRVRAVASA